MLYDKFYFDKLSDTLTIKQVKSTLFASLHYRITDTELLNELIEKVVPDKKKTYSFDEYFTFKHPLFKSDIIDRYNRINKIDQQIKEKNYKH